MEALLEENKIVVTIDLSSRTHTTIQDKMMHCLQIPLFQTVVEGIIEVELVFEVVEVVVVAVAVVEAFSNREITYIHTTTIVVAMDNLVASASGVILLDIKFNTVLSREMFLSKVSILLMNRVE